MIFTLNVELTCDFCKKSKSHTDVTFVVSFPGTPRVQRSVLPEGWTHAPYVNLAYRCVKCTAEKKGDVE